MTVTIRVQLPAGQWLVIEGDTPDVCQSCGAKPIVVTSMKPLRSGFDV